MEIHRRGPETERLIHRALVEDDAEDVFELNSNPRVMKHTDEPLWESVAQTRERLAGYPDFEEHGFGRWGCVYKPENRIIGFSGLKYLEDRDEVDLGYRFLPDYWGRGLATESGLACVRFGFETLGLERIVGFVLAANAASIRVLEKVGMHDTGVVDYDGHPAHRYAIERPAAAEGTS